jgi:hypothetical protein
MLGRHAQRSQFLTRIAGLEHFVWLLNRIPAEVPPRLHFATAPEAPDDLLLIKRVMAAYRRADAAFIPTAGFWDVWARGLKKPIHNALIGDDIAAARAILRDPASNVFFWGFDAIASSPEGEPEPHELTLKRLSAHTDWRELYALWLCDGLLSFAEAIGARRATYPEIDVDATLVNEERVFDVDAVIDLIEHEIGVVLNFPNPFPNELGLRSKRGIISFRTIQALYQGWRISQLTRGNRVLEIGAGLGRSAYFARMFGVSDYTIIDVPLTNAAQGYFLGRVIGEDNVALGGEADKRAVRIVPSTDLEALDDKYDLIVNVDSWTEMPVTTARIYWDFACEHRTRVLSINHEFNPRTVRELYRDHTGIHASRHPYPMRRGYVEEVISFD